MLLHDEIEDLLAVLAERLVIPVDMISVHREKSAIGGRPRRYRSIRYGAFLLTAAPLEAFFDDLLSFRERTNRVLGISFDKWNQKIEQIYGVRNVAKNWKVRLRAPGIFGRDPWTVLDGVRLRDVLEDIKSVRDRMVHGKGFADLNLKSPVFPWVKSGATLHLTTVEGLIYMTQDIASQAALAIGVTRDQIPAWPTPPLTTAGTLPRIPY